MKRFLTILLTLALLVTASMTAFAEDGRVIYSGNSGSFIFEPGSEYSPTDLFSNFKEVMPGDTLEQMISIRNDADNQVKIKLYMRALGAHEDSVEFLSQMSLRVEQVGTSDLFAAPADEKAQLEDWVYLGTIYSGGEIELRVFLDVPVSMDNRFKNLVGYLDWEFMVEELPVEEDDPQPPPTGDNMDIGMYVAILVGSGLGLFLLIFLGRRKKEEQEA